MWARLKSAIHRLVNWLGLHSNAVYLDDGRVGKLNEDTTMTTHTRQKLQRRRRGGVALPGGRIDKWNALEQIIADRLSLAVHAVDAPQGVCDDRGEVDGWTVTIEGDPSDVVYAVIPPEGDSPDCWMDSELADRLTPDDISDIAGWLR